MFELGSLLFRYLETAVLALLVVSTILIYLRRRPAGLVWYSAAAMSTIAVHLYLEEGRWQLLPAYALLFVLAIWIARPAGADRRYRAPGLIARIVVTVVAVPALALPAIVPLFRVSPGSGPHPVGSARVLPGATVPPDAAGDGRGTSHAVGAAATEGSSAPATARGRLAIWYPARAASSVAAPYWSADELARYRLPGLPWLAATHLPIVPTPATLRAPILDERLPLLVLVPGADSLPGDYLSVALEAASSGWLVVRMPPGADEREVLEALAALEADTGDAALEGRVDATRLVLVTAGERPQIDLGVPTLRLGADSLAEARLPSGGFALEAPGAEVPARALSTRYLMMRPARLLVGSSDIRPAVLDRLVRELVVALLADGSTAAPVFSGTPPSLDELVARYDGVVLRRLPPDSRSTVSRR